VEWLGAVPEHWHVDRLKASITSCRNGIWGEEAQGDENDIPCVRVADFDRQKLQVQLCQPTIRNVTDKERVGRLLERGNLLLEKSGGGEGQPVGCVVLYDDPQPAVCSNFVAKVELAPGMNPSYWRYVHAAAYAVRLTIGSINQTSGIQNLDQDRYFNERAAFPPSDEQAAIATFLDREIAKIDALVAEQRNLIELLKEKRQAVISNAVTKGLDPSVPMKDSGVEWLGEVPEHWAVMPLKRDMEFITSGARGWADNYSEDGDLFIRIGNLTRDSIRLDLTDIQRVTVPESAEVARTQVQAGDVLFSITAYLGSVAVAPPGLERAFVSQHVALVRPRGLHLLPEWIAYVTASHVGKICLEMLGYGGTKVQLSLGDVENLLVTVPPLHEQEAAVHFLDSATANFDALIAEAQSAISLLQERRTALISAAVTGQIDVRQAMPIA